MSTLSRVHPGFKALIPLVWLGVLMAATLGGGSDTSSLGDMSDPRMVVVLKIAQALAVLILFIAPALLIAFLTNENKLKGLQLDVAPSIPTFFLVLLLTVAALPVINWMAEMNNRMDLPESMAGLESWMRSSEEKMKELTEMFLSDTSVGGLILNLFVVAFMAAIGEEIFFRGVLQKHMVAFTRNVHAGVWISAILFSAIHLQFYGFFPRMILGAMLGYLFVWSRSLWVPILAHFVNNGFAVVMAWLMARGTIPEGTDTVGSQQEDTVFALSSAVIVGALLFAIYRIEKRRQSLPHEPTMQ